MKLKTTTYELRDVAIVQAPVSYCEHRGDVDNKVVICGRDVYPVFVSPMASVTDENNYKVWIKNGLTPIVPRSVQQTISFEERMKIATETFVSISLSEACNEFMNYLLDNSHLDKVHYICIDIAHGTLNSLYKICKQIKGICGDKVVIMTGNIANPGTYQFYADAGVDFCRVGIGNGSRCLCEGTKITMADMSTSNIEDISKGDYVMTMDGPKKVINTFVKKTHETIVINNDIECTKEHKFFVIKKSLLPKDKDDISDEYIKKHGEYIEADKLTDEYLLVKW